MKLPDEVVGGWTLDPTGQVVADENEQLIRDAVNRHLTRIGDRDGGWITLFIDLVDSSFWELTYPQSEYHGGGPSKLTRIAPDELSKLYPNLKTP